MTWYEAVLWLAALMGAVGTIVKFIKPISQKVEKIDQIDAVSADIKAVRAEMNSMREQFERRDDELSLGMLRLTLMSPEMPMSERIIAGDKYVKKGGNGDCKEYYEGLIREHIR